MTNDEKRELLNDLDAAAKVLKTKPLKDFLRLADRVLEAAGELNRLWTEAEDANLDRKFEER